MRLDEERSDKLTAQSQAAKISCAHTFVQDVPPPYVPQIFSPIIQTSFAIRFAHRSNGSGVHDVSKGVASGSFFAGLWQVVLIWHGAIPKSLFKGSENNPLHNPAFVRKLVVAHQCFFFLWFFVCEFIFPVAGQQFLGDRMTTFGMGLCITNFTVVMVLITEDVRKMLQGAMETTRDEGTKAVYKNAEFKRKLTFWGGEPERRLDGAKRRLHISILLRTRFTRPITNNLPLVASLIASLPRRSAPHRPSGSDLLLPPSPCTRLLPRRKRLVHAVWGKRDNVGQPSILSILRIGNEEKVAQEVKIIYGELVIMYSEEQGGEGAMFSLK